MKKEQSLSSLDLEKGLLTPKLLQIDLSCILGIFCVCFDHIPLKLFQGKVRGLQKRNTEVDTYFPKFGLSFS